MSQRDNLRQKATRRRYLLADEVLHFHMAIVGRTSWFSGPSRYTKLELKKRIAVDITRICALLVNTRV